ncbi:MAG TPA: DUF488 domain-containing protein [Candidatus Aquilonibacter sp.]|nr:DUF488 domain-containing protein [Candidatus Aquilonibacter sp.]
MIAIKRAYDPPQRGDGARILVDRLWPRGVSKEALAAEMWLKEVAPSDKLRKWFAHDVDRWHEFQQRYLAELKENPEAWQPIVERARHGNVTLLYAAKDSGHNNAVVLQHFLERHLPE